MGAQPDPDRYLGSAGKGRVVNRMKIGVGVISTHFCCNLGVIIAKRQGS